MECARTLCVIGKNGGIIKGGILKFWLKKRSLKSGFFRVGLAQNADGYWMLVHLKFFRNFENGGTWSPFFSDSA